METKGSKWILSDIKFAGDAYTCYIRNQNDHDKDLWLSLGEKVTTHVNGRQSFAATLSSKKDNQVRPPGCQQRQVKPHRPRTEWGQAETIYTLCIAKCISSGLTQTRPTRPTRPVVLTDGPWPPFGKTSSP